MQIEQSAVKVPIALGWMKQGVFGPFLGAGSNTPYSHRSVEIGAELWQGARMELNPDFGAIASSVSEQADPSQE
jgi:hypothetical protein